MATTINGVSRYAGVSVDTSFNGIDSQMGNLIAVQQQFQAADEVYSIMAPCGGKLVHAEVQSQTTTDGSNKVGLSLSNESNSAAAMFATTLFDDDPVLTSNTAADITLSTTAANLLVDQGDNLELTYDVTGTIAGGAVILYFEPNAD